jgi:hypothetical protein
MLPFTIASRYMNTNTLSERPVIATTAVAMPTSSATSATATARSNRRIPSSTAKTSDAA